MRTPIITATVVIALFSATAVSARETGTAPSDESSVQGATVDFYEAINAMFQGDIAPMKGVWSHADDITYMGPDGTVDVGWSKVLGNLNDQAKMKLGGEIHHEQIMLTISQDLAVMQCHEIGENIVDGKPVQVSLRATNVFRKENGEWKLIGHQTDKLPFMQK